MVRSSDKVAGKKVAIIGGSAGIGLGAAQLLLEEGAHVIIISSSSEKVAAALQLLSNPNAQGKVGDVRDEKSFTQLLLLLAPLDHIVYSSVDKIIRGPLAGASLEDAKKEFEIKFWGSILVGKALAEHYIIKSGGSLTLTSGAAGYRPGKGAAIGGALNGGLFSFTRGLAAELADKRIRVNTVVPGLVKTGLHAKLGKTEEEQKQLYEDAAQRLSVGFVATPIDIAEAYLYAIQANYTNGTLIDIDGGARL